MKKKNFEARTGRIFVALVCLVAILACSVPGRLFSSNKQTGPVQISLKKVFSQDVSPSETDQTISYPGKVNVIFPAGLVQSAQTLVISTLSKPLPPPSKLRAVLAAFDVALGDEHQFDHNLVIEISYDPKKLDAKKTAAEQLTAGYWDNDSQNWITLPSTVDETRHVISISTDHLSIYGFFNWIAGYNSDTSDHFTAYYDAKALAAGQAAYYKSVNPTPRFGVNPFINDILDFLEQSYKVYSDAGYQLPSGKIDVEVADFSDSELRSLIGNIRISTVSSSDPNFLRQDCAHELFHAVQRETLGIRNYLSRHWWMEATADYAADHIAWASIGGTKIMGMDIKPNYLGTTLTHVSPEDTFAYSTSHFVGFLVDTKKIMSFKALWDLTANGDNDVLKTLIDSTKAPQNFGYYYTEFARFFIFDPASPVKTTSISKDIASLKSDFPQSEKQLRQSFTVGYYTAKLWAIDSLYDRDVLIQRMDKNLGMVSYAVLSGDTRTSPVVQAPDSMVNGEPATVHLKSGDFLYILMDNTVSSDDQTFDIQVNENTLPSGMFSMRLQFDSGCDAAVKGSYNAITILKSEIPVQITGTDVSIDYDKTTGPKHLVVDGAGKINDKGQMTLNYTFTYTLTESCDGKDCAGTESGFGTFTGTWNSDNNAWEGTGNGSVDVSYPNTLGTSGNSSISCSAGINKTKINRGFDNPDL